MFQFEININLEDKYKHFQFITPRTVAYKICINLKYILYNVYTYFMYIHEVYTIHNCIILICNVHIYIYMYICVCVCAFYVL